MKKIADMKLSEKQRQTADELKMNFKAYQAKAQLLKAITDETVRAQTSRASTAFRIGEGMLDEQLAAKKPNP